MNKVFLIGRLTKDPELATTTSGVSVCNFTLAISRRFAGSDGERDADFINIVTWRNNADNCHKYLRKGSQVGLTGSIQTRSYDANDGSKRYVTEVVADEVEFIGNKTTTGASLEEDTKTSEKPSKKLEPIDDDTLPF